jgi:hypothetical protein
VEQADHLSTVVGDPDTVAVRRAHSREPTGYFRPRHGIAQLLEQIGCGRNIGLVDRANDHLTRPPYVRMMLQ